MQIAFVNVVCEGNSLRTKLGTWNHYRLRHSSKLKFTVLSDSLPFNVTRLNIQADFISLHPGVCIYQFSQGVHKHGVMKTYYRV